MSNSDFGAGDAPHDATNARAHDGSKSGAHDASRDPSHGNADALHDFSDALADAVARVAPSVVAIHARRRIPASGVVWREGYVVATDHTIRRETDITVTLDDGREVAATLVGRDASTDLALLKLADTNVPAAPKLSGSAGSTLRTGNIVMAVGRPGTRITATLGTVHAIGDGWRTWQGGEMSELIRVDISVHDGYSGSALIDSKGNVAGINSSMLTRGAPATIPAATIDRVVDQLLSSGRVPRGWLGIGTQPVRLPERVRTNAKVQQEVGLLLVNIATNSPAETAGLFVGDTLIALAGTPTREAEDVLSILGPDTVGRTLTARLIRAGEVVELPVVIGESPHTTPRDRSGDGGPHGGRRGGGGGGGPFGAKPFGGIHFGSRPFGSNPFGAHAFDASAFGADMFGAHACASERSVEAFEKLREFSESFGFGFARGCGSRRHH